MPSRKLFAALTLAIAAAVLAAALRRMPPLRSAFEPLERTTLDWRTRAAAGGTASAFALVLIDSAAAATLPYLSPLPRGMLADLIDVASAGSARVIGLNVFLDRRYPVLEERERGDSRLRESIRRSGRVVLAAATAPDPDGVTVYAPDPYFADVAAGVAAVTLPPAGTRPEQASIGLRVGERVVPTMPLALAAAFHGQQIEALVGEQAAITLPGPSAERLEFPSSALASRVPFRFLGPPSRAERGGGAFRTFSSAGVPAARGSPPSDWFSGKVVLIGASYDHRDRFDSPFADRRDELGRPYGWTSGTELIATATAALIGTPITRPGLGAEIILMFGVALLVVTGTLWRGTVAGAGTGLMLVALLLLAAWLLFGRYRFEVPILAPMTAVALGFVGSLVFAAQYATPDSRRIRRALAGAVAPRELPRVVAEAGRRVSGDRSVATVLVAQVTTAARAELEPSAAEPLLSRIASATDEGIAAALAEGGVLERRAGDSFTAIFGLPVPNADHAVRACRAAIATQAALQRYAGPPHHASELGIHIGMHTGDTIAGAIRRRSRPRYVAVGHAPNIAARVQRLSSFYDLPVLITGETFTAVGGAMLVRDIDRVALAGLPEPLHLLELLGAADKVPSWPGQFLVLFQQGLQAYRLRDFPLALSYFSGAAELVPDDGPAALYLERCRRHIAKTPPQDWGAVHRVDV